VTLTIFGDFNCPFSALASVRADVLLARGVEIRWRAIQHDPSIPGEGEQVVGDLATALATEVARIEELSRHDLRLHLVVPPVRSNTAHAAAALAAAADPHRLRRRLFAAVWAEGRNLGHLGELRRIGADHSDVDTARLWQTEFEALPRPVMPTLVLPDGCVAQGLGALEWLADLATAVRTSSQ
jgi:predicted DsbA family dithiol-disulfide isomerase